MQQLQQIQRDSHHLDHGLTFLIVPKDGKDATKAQTVKDFIHYVITEGQETAGTLHYANFRPALQQQNLQVLDTMTAGAKPWKQPRSV